MESKVKNLPQSQVKITIKATKEEAEPFYNKALLRLGNEVEIKGFRKGHIPPDVLEQHIGQPRIKTEMLEIMIQSFYTQAVKEHDLKPISYPKLELKKDEPFECELTVDVMPKVTVEGYQSIKVKPKKIEVIEKDVENAMETLLEQNAEYKKVDREAKKGDRIEIDFEGFIDGKPFTGGASKHHPVIIGRKMLIEDLEKQLIGLKAADEKEINVTFPKDYHAEQLKGKKTMFKIKVNQVDEVVKPNIDNVFAAKIAKKDVYSVEELKQDIKKALEDQAKHDETHRIESEVISEILKKTHIELPQALIEDELDHLWHNFKDRIEKQGLDTEKYLQAQKKTKEDVLKQWEKEAKERVTLRLGLSMIADELKIEADNDQLKAILSHIPQNERQKREGVIKWQLRLEKTLQHIIEQAIK